MARIFPKTVVVLWTGYVLWEAESIEIHALTPALSKSTMSGELVSSVFRRIGTRSTPGSACAARPENRSLPPDDKDRISSESLQAERSL